MQILIWKSYGDVRVYCAESTEQRKRIAEDVYDIIKSWSILPEDFDFNLELNNALERKQSKRFIKDFVDMWTNDSDSFEEFYFDTVRYD